MWSSKADAVLWMFKLSTKDDLMFMSFSAKNRISLPCLSVTSPTVCGQAHVQIRTCPVCPYPLLQCIARDMFRSGSVCPVCPYPLLQCMARDIFRSGSVCPVCQYRLLQRMARDMFRSGSVCPVCPYPLLQGMAIDTFRSVPVPFVRTLSCSVCLLTRSDPYLSRLSVPSSAAHGQRHVQIRISLSRLSVPSSAGHGQRHVQIRISLSRLSVPSSAAYVH